MAARVLVATKQTAAVVNVATCLAYASQSDLLTSMTHVLAFLRRPLGYGGQVAGMMMDLSRKRAMISGRSALGPFASLEKSIDLNRRQQWSITGVLIGLCRQLQSPDQYDREHGSLQKLRLRQRRQHPDRNPPR